MPIGLLPYHLDGKRWTWPREGKWSGWCSGAEVHLARQHGYRVEVERAVVWPARRAVMRGWAEHLVAQRDRIGGLPIAPPVAEAARYAVRALAIGCIGSLHTCYSDAQVSHGNMIGPTSQSPAPTSVGPGSRLVRPEWSAAIWALARTRLARVMLAQTSPVLGCTLDGFYVGGLAQLGEDRGRAGHFRIERQGQWPEPITSLPELYAMSRALTPVATEVAA